MKTKKRKQPKPPSFKESKTYKENKIQNRLTRIIFFIFIFFLPTQLGKHFFFDFSYINGLRIDYLARTIYFTDILLLFLMILSLSQVISIFKNRLWLLFIAIAGINTIFSISPLVSLYRWVKIFEVIVLFLIVKKIIGIRLSDSENKNILSVLFLGTLLQFLLSTVQLIYKHTLQGVFYFLGERAINLSIPDIAKASINGVELLRPYGTFSHPNSMAGFYLLLYFFIKLSKKFDKYFLLKNFLLFFCFLLILISFSKTAIIIFLFLNLLLFLSGKISCRLCAISRTIATLVVSLIFLSSSGDPLNIEKRLVLVKDAFSVFFKHPFFGVGLGSFVISLKDYVNYYPMPLYQPVHNIFLLIFSELGIIGTIPLIVGGYFFSKNKLKREFLIPLLVVIFTGMFDHYWLTLQQNLLLLGVVFALI